MYQIPESYRAYCTDPAVRTAVEHILNKSDKLGVPSDIEWDELTKFHRAVLSAHQVRCEYANYLIDLWEYIWQPALDNCGLEIAPRTIADTEEWIEQKLDTCTIFENSWFSRVFDVRGETKFTLSLGTFDDAEPLQVRITLCSLSDPDGEDLLSELNLGDDWITNEDDWQSHVVSRRGLAPIGDNGTVDLAPLCAAAADALAAVQGRTE